MQSIYIYYMQQKHIEEMSALGRQLTAHTAS